MSNVQSYFNKIEENRNQLFNTVNANVELEVERNGLNILDRNKANSKIEYTIKTSEDGIQTVVIGYIDIDQNSIKYHIEKRIHDNRELWGIDKNVGRLLENSFRFNR